MPASEIDAPDGAISIEATIDIQAPCERVIATYLDVEHWDRTFFRTIRGARLIRETERVKEILVDHKVEGRVPNRLILAGPGRIWLEEHKKRFDAVFLNEFAAIRNGTATRYTVTAFVTLKGGYRALKPFLARYVRSRARREITESVLEPLRMAAEAPIS